MLKDQAIISQRIEDRISIKERFLDLAPMIMKELSSKWEVKLTLAMDLDPDSMLHQLWMFLDQANTMEKLEFIPR